MAARIAVLATHSGGGEVGGAERFYVGLRDAIRAAGRECEIVSVLSDESSVDSILESYLRFYDLDLSDYDAVISTKAPGYVVRHRRHVCYLQHTMRVFYDMFDVEFPWADDALRKQRQRIIELDTAALSSPRIVKRFVIGEEVRQRMLNFNGLDAEVIQQATTMSAFSSGRYEYLFMPGRLHKWKRVDLAIKAMAHVNSAIELWISGTGQEEQSLRELAAGDPRIRFLGRVSDEQLLDLYSNALAVPFLAYREDFGLVVIEAFHSEKPVVTCSDSGEPARMVLNNEAGFVCPPDPAAVGAAFETLSQDRSLAAALGHNGAAGVKNLTWPAVAQRLLDSLAL